MFREKDLIELEKIFRELKEKSLEGAVIIVEGKKDVQALRAIGIEGEIIKASELRADDVVERIVEKGTKKREVILMTDMDSRGISLKKRLLKAFEGRGIIVDVETSKKVLITCKTKDVESISNIYIKMRNSKLK